MTTTNPSSSALRPVLGVLTVLAMGVALVAPLHANAQSFILMNINEQSTVSRFIKDANSRLWTFPSTSNTQIRSQAFWNVTTENRSWFQAGIGQNVTCACMRITSPAQADSGKAMIPGYPYSPGTPVLWTNDDDSNDQRRWEFVNTSNPHVFQIRMVWNRNLCVASTGPKNGGFGPLELTQCDAGDEAQGFILLNSVTGAFAR